MKLKWKLILQMPMTLINIMSKICKKGSSRRRLLWPNQIMSQRANSSVSKLTHPRAKTIHATMATGKVLPMMIATLMNNTFVNTKLWFPSIPKKLLTVVALMKAQLFHLAHVDGAITSFSSFLFLVRTVINLLKSPPRRKQSN